MAIDAKKADNYLRELLQQFEKEPGGLEPYTRRLITKYQEAQTTGDKLSRELEQLRSQIKQAEARVRSLELQAADMMGKASGYLDFLVSMKFEEEGKPELVSPDKAEETAGKKRKAS